MPIEILAHRGYWKDPSQKNRSSSFIDAFSKGYGVETDVRDSDGQLVISHDMPLGNDLLFTDFLEIYLNSGSTSTLAINVKSDGIQKRLYEIFNKYEISNYFVFDMSVPETVLSRKFGLNYFSRHSDIEPVCVLYDDCNGVWLDYFYDFSWLTAEEIRGHLSDGKRVCVVSPELHGEDHMFVWKMIKDNFDLNDVSLLLCTDLPDDAKVYFND